ncbi:MAG: hypothetical protein JXD18_13380 [Anaerolineae bacterium]|nr:hypothetical protein [Anaerolineae bacterium]
MGDSARPSRVHFVPGQWCNERNGLEQGRVIEHGNRERLAATPTSRFYHLLETGLEEVLA